MVKLSKDYKGILDILCGLKLYKQKEKENVLFRKNK